ncbi:MAG: hypothetical protein GY917_15600, partial [Planctomycetaceae bacterium]|nr:hypothetical protein [Planctomycetaceae bacterium]
MASSRPVDASYTVSDADDLLGTVAINQKQLPDDLDSEGSLWESLGTYDIMDGTLEVGLSNNGSRWTIADAIRIEKIADIIPAPEIKVALGGTDVVDGSTLELGSTVEGSAVTHTFTVKNSGTDTLTLSSIDGGVLPAGLVLASNLGSLSLDPQETTTFAVTVAATEVATLGATIQIGNNDSDENPFDITLAAVVEALPQFQIMDDGDAGFTASSGFYTWSQSGRDGDLRYADTGGNDTASWKFTELAMGEYQAWATWTVASSRPTDASYTVSDADDLLGTVAINQKQLPDDLDSEGSLWESLGTYDIVDGTLEVGL